MENILPSTHYTNDFKILKNNDPKFIICQFLSLGLVQVVKEMHVNKQRFCINIAGYFMFSVINSLDMHCLYLLFILQLCPDFYISISDTTFSESLWLETLQLKLIQLYHDPNCSSFFHDRVGS